MRVILHLDMDAFYASVEQRDRPELRGLPVIVGSPPDRRGVVCAASYEARKFGVRSAMPSRSAARLCPDGVFLSPRMDHYREESRQIFQVVADTGILVEQVSVDEAYMDASEWVRVSSLPASDPLQAAMPLAASLKRDIREQRGLTASVGIAANKLLAKLASDFKKPDGLTLVPEETKVQFLRPLPCRALHGVGRVTAEVLSKAGLQTVGDIQDYAGDLRPLLGSFGPVLKRFSMGIDDRPLELGGEAKSISSENTFLHDTSDRPVLRACLREQAAEIAAKLQQSRLGARTVQVKVRYADFKTLTRQFSVEDPVVEAAEIYRLGCWLLGRDQLVRRPLRLLGLGVSGLAPLEGRQLTLPFPSMTSRTASSVVFPK